MKSVEKKRHSKLFDVLALAQKHPEKAKKSPAFARLLQKIERDLSPVADLAAQAEQSTKGLTLEKNAVYSSLKAAVTRLCNVALGHASTSENVALESDWTGWLTKLRGPQDTFGATCTKIVAEIRNLSEHWADVGITEAEVAAVEANIALFNAQLPKGKALKTEKKKAVKKIAAISNTTTTTKKQVLRLAAAFMGVEDEFHADIMEIFAPKKRGAATEIVVTFKSAATQQFLPDHNARVIGRKTTAKSNKKGEIRFKFAKGGLKTIEAPLPNGEMRTFRDIDVPKGKTVTLVVEV